VSAVLPGAASASVPRSTVSDAERPIVEPPAPPSATERLEASRARLRTALMAIAHPPPKPSLLGELGGIGSFGGQILERLKSFPAVALVIESIEQWWAEHPLHAAGSLAEEASRRYIGPRRPLQRSTWAPSAERSIGDVSAAPSIDEVAQTGRRRETGAAWPAAWGVIS